MKNRYYLLVCLIVICFGQTAKANIAVTAGTGGTLICANKAVGGLAPGFTTLGVITMTEGAVGDMTNGFHILTLNAPAGWQFNTAASPALGFTAGRNVTAVNQIALTAATLTISINVGAVTLFDAVTITGLQVQATSTGAAAGNITAGVAAGLTGITTGVTNFGSLSLTPSLTPSVSIAAAPAGAICPGTNVTFTATPVNGGAPTYQWFLNGVLVAAGNPYNNSTLTNGNTIQVVMTPTGCVNAATANSNTINQLVTAAPSVTVTGGGVFCDNTTINASIIGAGTVYYQGVISGGTSVATPSTSQLISLQGTYTYYFRAQSGTCWGPEGSAVVTINNTPGAVSVNTLTTSSLCIGDSAAFVASATAPTVEILQQDFNSGLGSWTITNLAGIPNSFFQVRNSPGYLSAAAGDGSPYMEAAPDATGSAAVPTKTIVTSPSFSTVGYTSANLTFNEYYVIWLSGDTTVAIQYSTDGGANWNTILDEVGVPSGTPTWVATTPTTTLALPPAALGMPNVMLRWNYNSDWGFYWAIDNIAVNGVPTLSYTWAGVAGATGLSCTACDTTTITPTALGPNDYTVTTTVAGCSSMGTLEVTDVAPPTAYNVTGGGPYCAGGSGVDIALSNSDIGIDYQLFDGAGIIGAPVSGTGIPPLDFGLQLSAGTYTVLATNASVPGCSSPMLDSAIVTIIPLPVVAPITGDPTVCMGDTKLLTDDSTGGVWISNDPTVAAIDGVGNVTGVAVGNTTITYAVTNLTGCTDSVEFSLAVGNPMPAVTITPMTATVCHGNPVNIVASSAPVTYQWEQGGVAIPGATDVTYSTTVAGTYVLVLDNGTCTQNRPPVTILPQPNPVANYNTSGNYLYTGTFTTYQWLRNSTVISGATSSIYPPTSSGFYQVVVRDANGCMDTSAGYTILPTSGVNNVASTGEINVYPNPAASVLNIDAPMKVNVTIISPDGRSVMTQKDATSINIGRLANGVYLVMIYDEHNMLLKTEQFSKIN